MHSRHKSDKDYVFNKKVADALLFKGYFSVGKFQSPRVNHFPLYPDHRVLFSHINKMKVIANEMAKVIRPMKVDLIASREAAGVPFGMAVALALGKGFLYLRKEPKTYNVKSVILGDYKKGQRVAIVDDAISTGGDKKKIAETLEDKGLKVVGVIVILDAFYGPKYRRKQSWLRNGEKYDFVSMVRWPELMDYFGKKKFFNQEFCNLIKKQLEDPFKWQEKKGHWNILKVLALKEKDLIFHESFKLL